MTALKVSEIAKALPLLQVTPDIGEDEAMEAITVLGLCNGSLIGLVRFSGQTAWERHPAGDEFLHILAGKTHITVLAEGGPMRFTAEAGSAVVVPRGLWHSQCPDSEVTTMFITPAAGSERSMKKDPRVAG